MKQKTTKIFIIIGMVFLFSLMLSTQVSSAQNPSILTLEPSEVNSKFATLKGEITDLGSEVELNVSYRYKTEDSEVWNYTENKTKDSTGTFQYTIENLNSNTVYEYEFLAFYNGDSVSGGILTFETEPKDTLLNVDFSEEWNVTIFIIILVIAGLLFYLQQFTFSSLILIISGFVLMTSKINIILSLIVLLTGILVMFMGGNKE